MGKDLVKLRGNELCTGAFLCVCAIFSVTAAELMWDCPSSRTEF